MSNTRKDVKFHLKVVFNKHKTKVLFAEADNHFTDTLLSFLTLPLGKLVQILQKHCRDEALVIGSMNTLYNSLSNLDRSYFRSQRWKRMLLNPVSTFSEECCMLNLDLSDSFPNRYFGCEDSKCLWSKPTNITMYCGPCNANCNCGNDIIREIKIKNELPLSCGAFTVNTASFLITDDFQIFPNVTMSFIHIASELGIDQTDLGERLNVTFGYDEIMELLKVSITNSTPLTDVILKKGKCGSALPEFELGALSHKIELNSRFKNSQTMTLKAIVQKSTNRLLFVESDEDFVDFLFSLFTIPFGGVKHILGSSTPFFRNIINLHRSVADSIDGRFFEFNDIKSRLTQIHHLPYGYSFNCVLLPYDTDYMQHEVYYFRSHSPDEEYVSRSWYPGTEKVSVCTPKPKEKYVWRAGMFKVTDDLTVRPLSALDELNVPLSDVGEQVLSIGLDEALSIMKASLISTTPLSVVLGPMLMKQSKEGL